ncbi:MAG: hypothetical protein IIA87_00600 [Nanoarchaeota archaeon]|nr:hypothetical protein [Nanoarchaeota archaeon]
MPEEKTDQEIQDTTNKHDMEGGLKVAAGTAAVGAAVGAVGAVGAAVGVIVVYAAGAVAGTGAGTGAIVGAAIVGAAAAVGAVGVGNAIVAGAGGAHHLRPRNPMIGAVSGLAVYGTIIFGITIGYHSGRETRLIPFETPNDRGVLVERSDGTKHPYIQTPTSEYVPFDRITESGLSELTDQTETTRQELIDKRKARLESIYNPTPNENDK